MKYRGSAKSKMEIVNEYQNKYKWDPVDILRRKAKNDIFDMKAEGRSDKDI
jgi:hypothetical protein